MGDSYLFGFGGIEQFFEQRPEVNHGLPQVFGGRLPLIMTQDDLTGGSTSHLQPDRLRVVWN
jgi:hypothetical protein